jgi:hypothetical protein
MSDPDAARSFLVSEVEGLEPFDFVAVLPNGQPQHIVEMASLEDGSLEVRVPGRPPFVPELAVEARSALRDRGFASEDASDPTKPWTKAVADAAQAVGTAQTLLVEVFGEKPDARLDIAHGSHRLEHEARKKLEIARSRIEPVATEVLGRRPEQDADGDYVLPMGGVRVMIAPRIAMDGQIVIRIFAITNVAMDVTPELGLLLSRLNFGMMFGRFALDAEHRSIWFDESLLGEKFREEELRFAIRVVAETADEWDDRLKKMFGGATYQEALAGRTAQAPPPAKPGSGVGMYL